MCVEELLTFRHMFHCSKWKKIIWFYLALCPEDQRSKTKKQSSNCATPPFSANYHDVCPSLPLQADLSLLPSIRSHRCVPRHVQAECTPNTSESILMLTGHPTHTWRAVNCNVVLPWSILRAQLNRLCKYYDVKAKGTNEDIIHALYTLQTLQTICLTL